MYSAKHSWFSVTHTKAVNHTSVLEIHGISTYQLLRTDNEVSKLAAPDTAGQVGRHVNPLPNIWNDNTRITHLKLQTALRS
jgi:hypothetical protein